MNYRSKTEVPSTQIHSQTDSYDHLLCELEERTTFSAVGNEGRGRRYESTIVVPRHNAFVLIRCVASDLCGLSWFAAEVIVENILAMGITK